MCLSLARTKDKCACLIGEIYQKCLKVINGACHEKERQWDSVKCKLEIDLESQVVPRVDNRAEHRARATSAGEIFCIVPHFLCNAHNT